MKLDAVVVAALVGAVASTSARADQFAQTSNINQCDRCEDLCQLVDNYLEREALVDMFRQFAASNEDRTALPDGTYVVGLVEQEFAEWSLTRQLPCHAASFDAPAPGAANAAAAQAGTQLEVAPDSSCQILYDKKPMDGAGQQAYETATNCKAISDATIEHEKIHQRHCQNAFAGNAATAAVMLTYPANQAESELQALTKHRDMLAEQIRQIVSKKNCGWNPTEGQNASGAMPSPAQVKKMEQRGWRAVQSLAGGS